MKEEEGGGEKRRLHRRARPRNGAEDAEDAAGSGLEIEFNGADDESEGDDADGGGRGAVPESIGGTVRAAKKSASGLREVAPK